ncbi:MAG: 30S ribosomal protein S16 [Acidimicrobiia bacterium]|nr:30S ribosomal protein S16 [Acidimicrobiia bacterium]
MAVKMRLTRMGKKKSPYYRIVVIDGRRQRDGRYIDLIGRYDPREEPSLIEIDEEKAVDWLKKGVQPTEAVAKLLEISGVTSKFKVSAGKIHTVGAKPVPVPVEEAPVEPTEDEVAADASEEE